MNIYGWSFMIISWALIISLLLYCGYKLIFSKRV